MAGSVGQGGEDLEQGDENEEADGRDTADAPPLRLAQACDQAIDASANGLTWALAVPGRTSALRSAMLIVGGAWNDTGRMITISISYT